MPPREKLNLLSDLHTKCNGSVFICNEQILFKSTQGAVWKQIYISTTFYIEVYEAIDKKCIAIQIEKLL